MSQSKKTVPPYGGFEQGPIRPPSEAASLLIRLTRNCPWNRCTFCPVYKGERFSLRPVAHVKQDIDALHRHAVRIRAAADADGRISRKDLDAILAHVAAGDEAACQAALHWLGGGMTSIFLQDANSLIMRPADLIEILQYLKDRFAWVTRITSYARSHTIARISDSDLTAMAGAGLNRIHIGLESGSDRVLQRVRKGVDKATHIRAGLKVRRAGMELSEYVMPGLGGRELSHEHALETADALNHINPDFIRLRSLAIPNQVPLFADYAQGRFEKCTDTQMAQEILLFLEMLDGITSTLCSDHILNLFQDVEGKLPDDKPKMTGVIRRFLDMTPQDRVHYQIGRRLGIFNDLDDMRQPVPMDQVRRICRDNGITADNVDAVIEEVMKRFI
ncbi:MAG: radical SAM protein [Desulfobacterales bacterium]|nr:radical SAM protein [Desulfobacterales bacterium]